MGCMGSPRGCGVVGRAVACACVVLQLPGCAEVERRRVRIERVAPAADPDCGAPEDARTLLVRALGEFPATEATARSVEVADGVEFSIDGFPPGTSSLEIEVRGAGGALRAVGRTPEFDLDELDDDAVISVFMAPRNGFCLTGPPAAARDAPLLARAGAGVLIAGGTGEGGAPVHEVELYDPATGQFSGLGDPLYGSVLDGGLAGATMTAMPDGRVVVAGGGATAFQVYEPEAGFGAPQFLREARALHAAVALDDERLLLAGGCARIEDGGCVAGSGLATSVILSVSSGELASGPGLVRLRIGGTALREADGRVLVTGGVDEEGAPVAEAERIDPVGGRDSELVADTGAAAALLAAGGALTGFAPRGAPPSETAAVVPPGALLATRVGETLEPRAGPVLVPLESGHVLVVGGGDGETAAALYAPVSGALESLPSAPGGGRTGHGAVRLDDGSVLLVGGRDAGGAPLADAWIFRPDVIGPWSAALSATFATPESAAAMVPRDPARARAVPAEGRTPAHYRIEATGEDGAPTEWAILAGPRFTSLSLEASVAAEQGGVAILLWFRDEATTAVLALRPGQDAELFAIDAGEQRPLGSCAGQPIGEGDLAPPDGAGHALAVSASSGELSATLDGREVLRCDVDPPAAGLVGVAPLGGEGALLRLDLVSVSR